MLENYIFRFNHTVNITNDEKIIISDVRRAYSLKVIKPIYLSILTRLQESFLSIEQVIDEIQGTETSLEELYFFLMQLSERGFLSYAISHNDKPLITLTPMAKHFRADFCKDVISEKLQLSRFAYLHQEKEQLIFNSPLAQARIIINDQEVLAVIYSLSKPSCIHELKVQHQKFSLDELEKLLQLLYVAKIINLPELEQQKPLVTWEFHDLLFHTRHRLGRHDYPAGAMFPFKDTLKPWPVMKETTAKDIITLPKPDLSKLSINPSFQAVLEKRKSIRIHQGNPITLNQLSEFLFRSCRIKEMPEYDSKRSYDISFRPYPGGGACYEIEIYLTINRCEDLAFGLYRYNPLEHTLEYLETNNNLLKELLLQAARSTGKNDFTPDILFTFTARFARVAWKYQSMAYAVILKNIGVLIQTLYLVATAMDLAPCGIGNGDADLFAQITGLDYYDESSVGEFMLGKN
jgi:SagB-type dehydrogenase family enzyme